MLQSIFWLVSSKTIIQALSLVSTIAVARILDPADYGLMAIASLLISVSGMVSEFGAGSAIIQFRDLDRRELNGIFWLTSGLSVMVYLLLYAAAPPLADWFGRPELVSVLRVAGLALPLSTLRVVPENLLRREMRFDRIAVANVAAACLAIPAIFLLAMRGAGVWALVASAVVMVVVQTASMFISTRWVPGTDVGTSRLGPLMRFCRHTLGGGVCWAVYQQIDVLFLGKYASISAVGTYSMSMQLIVFPIEKMFSLVNEISYPAMARLQDDVSKLRYSLLRGMKLVAIIALPVYVGFALVASDLVPLLLTEKWNGAVPIIQILSAYGVLSSLAVLQAPALMARYRADLMFRYTFAQMLVMPVAFWAGSAWFGATGVALAWVLIYPIGLAWLMQQVLRELDLSWTDIWHCVYPAGAAVIVMASTVLAVRASSQMALPGQAFPLVVASIMGGALCYAATIWVLERPFVAEISRLLVTAMRPSARTSA